VRAGGVQDLRGASVAVGSAGSGTEQSAREVLAAYGLGYDDIDARYLSFAESAAALRDGAVDAAFLSVGFPAGAVLEATTTGGARLLPVDGEGARRLIEDHPYYQLGFIPAETYPGVAEDLPTVSMMNWIVGMETLDPAVVRSLLNVLGPGRVSLEQVHEMANQIDIADLHTAPVPLHEETARWLAEAGS
jgi:TRAP transporter TAXI family solute receptor